jgi:hypothetical protein
LNVCGVNDVRQTETRTAELLVSETSTFDVEMVTEKLRRHKSPGTAEIPAELRQEMGHFVLRSQITKVMMKYVAHLLRIRKSQVAFSASITPTLKFHLHPRSDLV